jgi:hypothetical protein
MGQVRCLATFAGLAISATAYGQINQNFDTTALGTLPAGWSQSVVDTGTGATAWTVVNTQSSSAPNSVSTNDVNHVSTQYLVLPAITSSGPVTIDLLSYYQTENTYDGWTVESSINGGAFANIGASAWTLNGYNNTISTSFSSPIAGQQAFSGTATTWTAHSATIVPPNGSSVVLRINMSSDNSVASTGVWLDNVAVSTGGASGACCTPLNGCALATPTGCTNQGGTYGGDGSTCATLNCPTGACCIPPFTCSILSPAGCTQQAGVYRGDNSTCATANCPGPTSGPDVIVGECYDIVYHGAVGTISAYSVGTDSCNLGDVGVSWVQGTNAHPAISGNMFRLKTVNGASRFEQIGLSWFKNGFLATNQSFCGPCGTPSGAALGPGGCSDIYSASLNGNQSNMGPRSVVNGTTGDFPYPYTLGWNTTGDAIFKHLQVLTTDVTPAQNAGAMYFVDAHYLTADDARFSTSGNNATNGLNNYSYRELTASSMPGTTSVPPTFAALTHQQVPGIQAWRDKDASVALSNAEYIDSTLGPNTNIVARFIVGAKATSLGGGQWHYEYAVYNVNADRSGGSFSVPLPPGAVVTNVDFHAPFYHSGEVYDNTAWNSAVTSAAVTWTSAPYPAAPANANAIRWGTMYNFRFDANVPPATGAVTLGLFKAGSPASIQGTAVPVPGGCYANCDGSTTAPVLNVADFTCFLQKFAASDPYANCDGSTTAPVLNVADFTCFLQKYASGCP